MERLTEWNRNGHAQVVNHHENYIDRLAEYEDTGLTPEEIEYNKKALELFAARPGGERVLEIAKAEIEGRIVVLPCKVGEMVWGVIFDTRECPHCIGIGGCFGCVNANPIDVYQTPFTLNMYNKIGKAVFLTREEAEAALEESRNE